MAVSTIDPAGLNIGQIGGTRNLIINGAMQVAQRGTSANKNNFVCDRWKFSTDTASASLEQSTDAPTGFTNSFKVTNSTSGISAGAYREWRYIVEAQDLASSGWDYTNSSSYLVFSFWVKSSVAQTMAVLFRADDTATNKYFSRQFTINSADTWEYKTMTVIGDSGLIVNNDNGAGMSIFISPYYGTNYASASSDGVWASSQANAMITYDTTWGGTTNATMQITGVQLEVSDSGTATPFEHESYGTTLQKCLRFYYKFAATIVIYPKQFTPSSRFADIFFPAPMRATPTVTLTKDDSGSYTTYFPDQYHWKGYVSVGYTDTAEHRITSFLAMRSYNHG